MRERISFFRRACAARFQWFSAPMNTPDSGRINVSLYFLSIAPVQFPVMAEYFKGLFPG